MSKRCQIPANSSKAAESTPLSTCSTVGKRLQFGPTFLAEGAQRIDRMSFHQLTNFWKGLVGLEIRVDDQKNDRVRFLDHGGARHDTHPANQRVDADQRRDLR